MSKKTIMLLTAIASILCAIWAFSVKSGGVAIVLIGNAIFSFIMAFRLKKIN